MAIHRKAATDSSEPISQFPENRKIAGMAPKIASRISPWLPAVIFYTVLANIPFWVASGGLGISTNGWFCLDYLAVGLVALFVPRILAAGLLLLAIAIDLIAAASETYFLPISQFFTNVGAVRQFSGVRVFALASVVLLSLLAAAFAAAVPVRAAQGKCRARVAVCLIAFAILSLAIDAAIVFRKTGSLPGLTRSKRYLPGTIPTGFFPDLLLSRIPSFRLIRRKVFPAPLGLPMRSATAIALGSAGLGSANYHGELPNLVVILVESWGLDQETSVSNALLEPYAQPGLLAHYQVLQGTVPFSGPTLGGEARELCGSTMAFHLEDASAQELEACLPDRLAALGYHDVAIHGMFGDMFDRVKWYPRLGFQEMWFIEQFHREGLPNCNGAFWGTCDAAIAEWMGRRLETRAPNPEFLYWVTLNSHLPVLVPNPLKSPADCSFAQSLSQQPSLCSWYQLIANVHQSAARVAMANLARPTVFVIVGDHAPPFIDSSLRNQFSQSVVPYILLTPRQQPTK